MGNGDGRRVAGSAERDGTILAQGRTGGGRRCWIIVGFAVGLEQEKSIVVIERLASDVGVYVARGRLILEGDVHGSHCADFEDVISLSWFV